MQKLIEKCFDTDGNLLWEETYKFRRLFASNQEMIYNGIGMTAVSRELRGTIVVTIVKLHSKWG